MCTKESSNLPIATRIPGIHKFYGAHWQSVKRLTHHALMFLSSEPPITLPLPTFLRFTANPSATYHLLSTSAHHMSLFTGNNSKEYLILQTFIHCSVN